MTVVLATKKELNLILALENISFTKADGLLSKRALLYHLNKKRVFCLKENGEVLGYALVLPRKIDRIYSFCIHPKARGKGLAKELLSFLTSKFKKLRLEVRVENAKALKLYESFGFRIVKRVKEFYLDGQDAYIMKN